MMIESRPSESVAPAADTLDDDFFDSTGEPPPEEDDRFEAPRDAILERKMSLAVRARRARFTRLVMGAVVCAVLLLLGAMVSRLAPDLRTASAPVGGPTSADVPLLARPALAPSK